MAANIRAKATAQSPAARDLVTALDTRSDALGLAVDAPSGRLATARDSAGLVERLAREGDDVTLVQLLASSTLPAEDAVAARSLSSAAEVSAALAGTHWSVIEALPGIAADRAGPAAAILEQLHTAAAHDEHAEALAPVLLTAVSAAAALLARSGTTPPPTPPPPTPPSPTPPPPPPGSVRGTARGDLDTVISELTLASSEHPGAEVHLTWDIRP